ncbi:MAG: hypothetical protein PHT31_02980 [Candidatus Omnitrophica bacterium]|nr:hypothetical protein [Candidatus Omnitrophota bacterium]MDD5653112.1 hypothetical protein [Candidatus Omnitrophota bacterium]
MRIFLLMKLLDDYRVIQEIERYKWIESERVGWDIGKERATLEWLRAYGKIWLKIHKPEAYKHLLEGETLGCGVVAAAV